MLASFTRKWAGAALRVSRSSSQRRRAVGTGCLAIVCCLALAYCLARVISAPPAHGAPNDVPPFPRNPTIPTEVVIIGTRHSAQLEYEDHAPARIRALLNRIGPAAVGVETPPRWFERDVYYEIAYESYGVGVPWAEEKGKEVRPIDWQARGIEFINALAWPDVEPPVELEIETGFEAEVEPGGEPGVEPEVDIPLELWDMRDFFFADTPEWRDLVNREYAYATPDPNPWNEAVRRYMLYRNLMIAREIVNLAADYEGQRVVVLIGAAHKPDLDLLLESVPNIVVRHASEWSGVSDAEVAAEERRRDHLAILWFNLAGSLVDPSDVDLDRMDDLLAKVEREAPDDPEVGFLRARRHAIAGETAEALAIYRYLAWDSEWEDRPFTYPDRALAERVNELNNHELQELRDLGVHPTPGPVELGLGNVISPVANLTIRQRILYEIAQQDEDLGARGRARAELDSSGLNSTQREQLRMLLEPEATPAGIIDARK